ANLRPSISAAESSRCRTSASVRVRTVLGGAALQRCDPLVSQIPALAAGAEALPCHSEPSAATGEDARGICISKNREARRNQPFLKPGRAGLQRYRPAA